MSDEVAGPIAWRNWQAFLEGKPQLAWSEYAFYSDTHFTGEFELGPYQILNAVPIVNDVGRPVLYLRVGSHLSESDVRPDMSKTDTSSYHGGWIADEFAALLSLALGRRVMNGGETRTSVVGDDPRGKPFEYGHRRPYLPRSEFTSVLPRSTGSLELTEVVDVLELYRALDAGSAVALARAARLYQRGIWIADDEPSEAWVRLVSSMEAAAGVWSDPGDVAPAELLRQFHPGLHRLLVKCGGDDLAGKAAGQLTGILGAQRKFLAFFEQFAPGPPANDTESGVMDWGNLDERLKRIYDYRSRELHDGVPFPVPMCNSPEQLGDGVFAERSPGLAASASGAVWKAEDLPMHLWVFEYIARCSLLAWWRSQGPAAENPPIVGHGNHASRTQKNKDT